LWVFIAGDMSFFALLFGAFMAQRMQAPALFEQSRHALNFNIGGINTLILLASSWFVVMAVEAARRRSSKLAGRWLLGALACGLLFAALKVTEYAEKIRSGYSMLTNDFFMFYFVLTGIHLLHVLGGCAVLTVFAGKARSGRFAGGNVVGLECAALYWHMVDLLWIVLFPLLYLLR
jgi:nitric oxide reductase NorE protein